MRRLSEVTYPERYALCPTCKEAFIVDVMQLAPPCPNDTSSMFIFTKYSELKTYVDRCGFTSTNVELTLPTALTDKIISAQSRTDDPSRMTQQPV